MVKHILILTLTVLAACSPMHYVRDVPNLAQVDANVWRSGQIETQEGWDYIAELAAGRMVHVIKLNFDNEGSDALAVAMGFDVRSYAIQPEGDQDIYDDIVGTLVRPVVDIIMFAEGMLSNAASTETTDFYLVHCTHGQDRTGLVVGMHRVLHDGWSARDAYGEMLAHNFHPELVGLQITWMLFAGGEL